MRKFRQPKPEPAAADDQPAEQTAAAAAAERNKAVRRAMAEFGAALPGNAHASGHHEFEDGGEISDQIPDGKYRVIGSEWAGRFEGGRLVEAFRCVPPRFGGDDIEIIS